MSGSLRKAELLDHLKQKVLTLALRPGSDLDEAALCKAFDLSRTPVREVFRELDGLGYLSLRDGRSPKVAELSHLTLRSFFLVAPMIYSSVLRLAAQSATQAQLDDLRAAQETFRTALNGSNAAQRTLANHHFHAVTGDMAANSYLMPSFERLLIDHARIGMTFYSPSAANTPETMDRACAQHDAIIAAIAARDDAAAAQLAIDHWALSRDQIETFLMPSALDQPLGDIPSMRTA